MNKSDIITSNLFNLNYKSIATQSIDHMKTLKDKPSLHDSAALDKYLKKVKVKISIKHVCNCNNRNL